MIKLFKWIDDNLLTLVTGFLLAFIPLYPKLPLFDALPGYIVRIRLEDFLVSGTIFIWLIQLWRKKISFGPNPLIKPIVAYLLIGILSIISAIFITQTIPMQTLHIEKTILHYLRRIEYFSLFFIFYSTIKSIKQLKAYVIILITTIFAVTIYGYGQKYLYWPAFSTMNREFAKGWVLYLSQHARVLSTFGGHYDLAAFIMMALVLLWALFFSIKKVIYKVGIFIVLGGAFWLLILTASRTSFLAYLAGVTILFIFWSIRKGIKWSFVRWISVVTLSILIMLSFGDLSERFTKLLKIDQRINGLKSLLLNPISKPPSGNQIAILENNLEAVTSKSDFPPLPVRPNDVTEAIPESITATMSASGSAILSEKPRTYSQTALVYDLSTGIRLDALWPRAIAGFKKNPLLGTGYATLTKVQNEEFTDAESTDNDYLRALGETGILGFLTFGWILFTIFNTIWKNAYSVKNPLFFGILIGFIGILVGILTNAVYIDIFEASKVAFSFWSLTGIVLGSLKVLNEKDNTIPSWGNIPDLLQTKNYIINTFKKIYHSPVTYFIFIVLLAFCLRLYKIHEPLADWHSWRQADTSAVTRNYVKNGIDLLNPKYDDISSVASGKPNPEGYRYVEFPLYNFLAVTVDKLFPGYNIEYSGRLTSIIVSCFTLLFIYLLTKKYFGVRISLLSTFFYAILPYNIFWTRTILPEPTLVFLTTGLVYFFDKYIDTYKLWWWILVFVFGALALLVKVTTAFFFIPLLYLAFNKWRFKIFTNIWLYLLLIFILTPFILWRIHLLSHPEGIPAYLWLLNGNGIRFKGAWWWWLFSERISKMILGSWGVGLLLLGVVANIKNKIKTNVWLFHYWLLGMLIYLAVFATGNVQHDYYQIILVPILCIFLAVGADFLLTRASNLNNLISRISLIVIIIFIMMFGWYQARDLYNINHPEIVEAGSEFNRLVASDKVKVIAPYNGDTAFLYQTGKKGWPLMEGSIDDMIAKGAQYFISVNFDDLTNQLIKIATENKESKYSFKIIKQTKTYVIIQLVADRYLPKN